MNPFEWKDGQSVTVSDGDHEFTRLLSEETKQKIGVRDLATAERFLEQNSPEYRAIMRRLYPRVYENTGRYHSPKLCAAAMACAVIETERVGLERTPVAYRLLMMGMADLVAHQVPMFFIAPDLLEAVMRTDFHEDINWLEMKLPYETGIFILPRGALPHPTDGDTGMILWSRSPKGPMRPVPFGGIAAPELANTAFILESMIPESMIWYNSTLSAAQRPTMRLHNLFYRQPGEAVPKGEKASWMDDDLDEKDAGYLEKVGVIAFGTLMAMNARPELVERSRLIKRVGKAEKAKEFWSPNVIGAKYKAKREVPKLAGDGTFAFAQAEHGTHASPRLHWRRGHFRMHAYGAGYKLRKQLWIEPVLVGKA
jgi:hypothetical protein